MSAYSAPERNTGTFISAYHPKKIFSTDHTHSGFGDGDVKKSGSNDFTGTNSFSNETTFTNTNPITLETDVVVILSLEIDTASVPALWAFFPILPFQ